MDTSQAWPRGPVPFSQSPLLATCHYEGYFALSVLGGRAVFGCCCLLLAPEGRGYLEVCHVDPFDAGKAVLRAGLPWEPSNHTCKAFLLPQTVIFQDHLVSRRGLKGPGRSCSQKLIHRGAPRPQGLLNAPGVVGRAWASVSPPYTHATAGVPFAPSGLSVCEGLSPDL